MIESGELEGIAQEKEEVLSLETIESEKGFSIYPNPSNGAFQLKMEESLDNANISIMDVTGKIVYSEVASGLNLEIDLSHQARGVYFVRIDNGNEPSIKKIIIQ